MLGCECVIWLVGKIEVVAKMIVYKMTVNKMTAEKMTLDRMIRQND